MNAAPTAFHCWHCCGNLRSKRRAKKPGCSATTWSPTHASCRPIISSRRSSLLLEHVGTVSVFLDQKIVGHFPQPRRQCGGKLLRVGMSVFAVDRAHSIDVL